MSEQLVRVGIIGYGTMGRIRHEALDEAGGARVVAVADPGRNPALPGMRFHSSGEKLIADEGVDAVFVSTPNHLNKSLTIAALEAGKHVFCEKPPAFTSSEVEEIMEAERASGGRKLMYGFNHRHHDSVLRAKEMIDSGVYGRILWMRGRYGKSVDESFYKNWRSQKKLAGGGILLDQGIHMLDLFVMMAGDFDDVQATVSNLYWNLDVEDNVFAILRSPAGVVASLHSTMTQWRHLFSLEIFLERGYIVINGLLTTSGSYGEESMTVARNRTAAPAASWTEEDHLRFRVNNSWRHEVEHFVTAVAENRPVAVGTSMDAWRVMRLVDKIYEGSRRG